MQFFSPWTLDGFSKSPVVFLCFLNIVVQKNYIPQKQNHFALPPWSWHNIQIHLSVQRTWKCFQLLSHFSTEFLLVYIAGTATMFLLVWNRLELSSILWWACIFLRSPDIYCSVIRIKLYVWLFLFRCLL